MPESMVFDSRPIKAIHYDDESRFMVGESGVTKIEPYFESNDTWLAVYCGEDIHYRLVANKVTVQY